MSWRSTLCKVFFVMELLRLGKLVPFVPYFYLSIILFFILSFLHLPVHPVGYKLKSPGVAHEAQLLITIGRGEVRSVEIFRAKSCKVTKGTDYPFVWAKSFYHKIERWYPTLVEPPSDPGQKCSVRGAL